jgi:peptidoglycan/LPS O-acetylase OafA/YrhL
VKKIKPYKPTYRKEIDGLRAFAVLSVVIFHSFPLLLKGGFIGVDVFFVISGFLITSHIFEKLGEGKFSFTDFFGRRILRIFPALILVLVSSLTFGWFVLLADEYTQLGKHAASGAAFIVNFILVGESGYFDNASETKPLLHLWSLAVEEQFYIIWPLVLWFTWKRKFNILTITLIVAFISFYLNLKFVASKPTETFYWPVGRFWELLSGSTLAWLLLYKRDLLTRTKLWIDKYLVILIRNNEVAANGSTTVSLMSLLGFLLLAYGVIRINENLAFPSTWALIPILGTLLIIAAGSKAWFNRMLFMNPIAVWFGLISYPLYLWHWPVLSFLQIIDGELPHRDARIAAVILSIMLAWVTYKFIEKPIRFGGSRRLKITALSGTFVMVGLSGLFISHSSFDKSIVYDDLLFNRKISEHSVGHSLKWYAGKQNWLFLGNAYDNTVAELTLAQKPSKEHIEQNIKPFSALAEAATLSNTTVALFIGPNKSSVYPEFLPDKLVPSTKKYISFFTDQLNKIPNITVYDPTNHLLRLKGSQGILYWRTNTHWNLKGAYLAFSGFSELLNLPTPNLKFTPGPVHNGDLIGISQLKSFPLSVGDNWDIIWKNTPELSKSPILNQPTTSFGKTEIVVNKNPLSDKTVWVIGDSFTSGLRDYFNMTFKETHYLAHWAQGNLEKLPQHLINANKKPDMVIVVKVERSF